MGFGGSQDEDNMGWRFLEGLEQSIGGFFGEHMDFIYYIDLIASLVGSIIDPLTEVSDFINTPVTGSINFYDIQSPALSYCLANMASIARLTLAVGNTIHCLSQNAPGGGLTCSPGTTKKVGMSYTTTSEGIA